MNLAASTSRHNGPIAPTPASRASQTQATFTTPLTLQADSKGAHTELQPHQGDSISLASLFTRDEDADSGEKQASDHPTQINEKTLLSMLSKLITPVQNNLIAMNRDIKYLQRPPARNIEQKFASASEAPQTRDVHSISLLQAHAVKTFCANPQNVIDDNEHDHTQKVRNYDKLVEVANFSAAEAAAIFDFNIVGPAPNASGFLENVIESIKSRGKTPIYSTDSDFDGDKSCNIRQRYAQRYCASSYADTARAQLRTLKQDNGMPIASYLGHYQRLCTQETGKNG